MLYATTLKRLALRLSEILLSWADFAQALAAQTRVKTRNEVERIVMLEILGTLNGVPIVPPALTLRLLPYFVPKIYQWRRMNAERPGFDDGLKGIC